MAATFVDFRDLTRAQLAGASCILREALANLPSAYGEPGAAEAEVERLLGDEDWLGYAALEEAQPVGWIGALQAYERGWEIHPLVVTPGHQRRGIGSSLLQQLEARARRDGILTLFLGSDDDYGGTTLFGRPLFPDVLAHAADVDATPLGHALTFYRRHGYRIVGLLPDVNGAGRPDILMAKQLS